MTNLPATFDEAELSRQLDRIATAVEWQPQAGDRVIGTIAEVIDAAGPFGAGKKLVLETSTGRIQLWLTGWLREELRRQGARIGSGVAIQFCGKGRNSRGSAFNRYAVFVATE